MILIEKELLKRSFEAYTPIAFQDIVPGINAVINIQPTIEIVRCRECKHRFVDGENVRFNVCELNHNKVQADDWFCADGERRNEDDSD